MLSKEQNCGQNTESMLKVFDKFSEITEKGFLAVEEAIESDLGEMKKDIENIKQRLDRANL